MWKKRKKFNYPLKDYSNPFFRKRRPVTGNLPLSFLNLRLIIFFLMLIVALIIYLFYFSPLLKIKEIKISGVNRISEEEIKDFIWRQLSEGKNKPNIFLFDIGEVMAALEEEYGFKNLSIKKNFPSAIFLSLQEPTLAAVWHEGDRYYYMDIDGNIISEVNALDVNARDYPIIDGDEKGNFGAGARISYIINLFNDFKDGKYRLEVEQFKIDSEINTVQMFLKNGPLIYFNVKEDMNNQIAKLLTLKNEKLKDSFNQRAYIDLRYGDRVYYK